MAGAAVKELFCDLVPMQDMKVNLLPFSSPFLQKLGTFITFSMNYNKLPVKKYAWVAHDYFGLQGLFLNGSKPDLAG